ncbi:MAG: GNAT family N-acetyltransferase [Aquiluna sp.]
MPFRAWQESDVAQIVKMCNAHDSAIDSEFEDSSEEEIRQELTGFYDEVFAEVYEEDGVITDLVSAQVDKKRKRVEIDVFGLPEKHNYDRSMQHALSWIKQNYPDYEVRSHCNDKDLKLRKAITDAGLHLVRKYWTMRNYQPDAKYPKLPSNVKIRRADFEGEKATWHFLLMDSFSDHYGFQKKAFHDWLSKQEEMPLQDENGVFFLEENGLPVGFLVCTNHRAENQGGFIDKLGVRKNFRGRGYGEMLLKWGCAYSVERGFKDVALGVDTGNETGAVALYEKSGFKSSNVWLAFSDSE